MPCAGLQDSGCSSHPCLLRCAVTTGSVFSSSVSEQLHESCWEAVGVCCTAPFMLLQEAEYVLKDVGLKVVDTQAMGSCNQGPLPAPCTFPHKRGVSATHSSSTVEVDCLT